MEDGVVTVLREKRSYTRITLDIPACVALYQMEAYHSGPITNISQAGCFFPFDGNLPVGEHCVVTINVGEGLETEKITVTGIIARSDSDGIGINFTDNTSKCRLQLEKIISHEAAK